MLNNLLRVKDKEELIAIIRDLEAKLQDFESNKVAEFSGELYLWNGDDWLNNIENLVSPHLSIDDDYTVIISREK